MATRTKRATPSKGTASPRPASRPPTRSSKPSLRFHYAEELRKKTLRVLDALEGSENPAAHRDALADVVLALTKSGLDYYYLMPLKVAKAGFILQQSANLGLAGVNRVIAPVVRQIIGRMDGPQLVSVAGSIRQFMR